MADPVPVPPQMGLQYVVDDPHVNFSLRLVPPVRSRLDVITPTTYQPIVDVLNTWDDPAIGATTNSDLFGKSFTLRLYRRKPDAARLRCGW